MITVRAREVSLREALDQIAQAGRLRFSYSADLLQLDRVVCQGYESVAVGDALADLLAGTALQPIVASDDHIVLAPRRAQDGAAEAAPQPLYPLRPLVAMATAARTVDAAQSYAVTRIEHKQLSQQGSVAQAMMASVPGMWVWQTPAGFTAQYSARGASSFGASSPKIYIDGIEVANPQLVAQIVPENIERIEVIRGPQGGALYGGDAINGVTNIVTRHESVTDGTPRFRVRTGFAFSNSAFSENAGLGQDHTAALQFGSVARSGVLNLGIGSVGEYIPGTYTRHVNLDGGMRLVSPRTVITGTARFFTRSAGDSVFHQLTPLSMQQYAVGARAVHRQNEHFTHSLVIGVDGYALNGVAADSSAVVSVADSVLLAAGDGALRTTLRLSSAAQLALGSRAHAVVTLAGEHSALNEYGSAAAAGAFAQARSSNGISAQLDASLDDRMFVNAGIRVQNDELNSIAGGSTVLPMLGAAYVAGSGGLTLKLRGAYGKAIRWPDLPTRITEWSHPRSRVVRPVLSPEQQTGLEAGLDLTLRGFGLQVTRYDQTASGLQQRVEVNDTTPHTLYAMQSVGEINNHGWELQAFARRGALEVNGALSMVHSRVLHLADGYTGDLRRGDRMPGVPAKTLSVNAAWTGSAWSTSLTAYRALDWMSYDRRALAAATLPVTGMQLRDYWRAYNGSTRLRATFVRELRPSLTLLIAGDNMLGTQTGEPDNLTIVPGRTISLGVRASF